MSTERKIYTFNYSFSTINTDNFECEADDQDEADDLFDDATCALDDVDINFVSERPAPPFVDPDQMAFPDIEKNK